MDKTNAYDQLHKRRVAIIDLERKLQSELEQQHNLLQVFYTEKVLSKPEEVFFKQGIAFMRQGIELVRGSKESLYEAIDSIDDRHCAEERAKGR
jgi:regulator of sirC expression with transglutaminase-like and TPR domain